MLGITRRISRYNYSSRKGNSIKYIVLHYTGNKQDSALGNANYFNGGDRNASAHYFVDNNSIYQVVEESNAAWSVGDGYGKYGITNYNSINIEMCTSGNYNVSDQTENNAIDLVKSLMTKYNIDVDHVVRHYDASRKVCPNWSDNNWSRWSNFKSKLVSTPKKATTSHVQVTNTSTVNLHLRDLQGAYNKDYGRNIYVDGIRGPQTEAMLNELCLSVGTSKHNCTAWLQCRTGASIDGIFGNGTKTAVMNFQRNNGLVVDGIAGRNTFNKLLEIYR